MLAAASLKISSEVPLGDRGRTRYSLPCDISTMDSLEAFPKRYLVAICARVLAQREGASVKLVTREIAKKLWNSDHVHINNE